MHVQAWTTVGVADFSAGEADYVSLALHPTTGEPYVAYIDGANNGSATVMTFKGSAWSTVGEAGFSASQANWGSQANSGILALHPITGAPYVAYNEGAWPHKATVMTFNGSAWTTVGAAGFSDGGVDFVSLALDPTTELPYVAYNDGANRGRATVMTFNGSDWLAVGDAAGFSDGMASDISLALHPTTGKLYVAYTDAANSYGATVVTFNGSAWLTVGAANFSGSGASSFSLVLHNTTGTPYVAYNDGANNARATVMTFNGSDWLDVGAAGFSAGVAACISLALHPITGAPYVAYQDGANNKTAAVMTIALPAH